MCPMYVWPEKVQDSLTTHMATVPKVFNRLLFTQTLSMYLPNLKSVALPVPEIIGGTPKIGEALDTPTVPFLENF